MYTAHRFLYVLGLALLLVILPQCTEKKSNDYVQEGIGFIEAQDFQRAELSFKHALEKNPKNAEAHYGLGGIYNYQGRYEEAKTAFKTALRLDPAHMDAHYSLGYTYEQMGEMEKSEKEKKIYARQKKRYDKILADEQAKR
jgi:Tfp pilus assembly protein PilF